MQELFPQFFSSVQQAEGSLLSIFGIIEVIGYGIIILCIGGIIYYIIALGETKKRSDAAFDSHFITQKTVTSNDHTQRWDKVVGAIRSSDEQLWRVAIMDADTILEEVVSRMGVPGETLGEQLKNLGNQVVWIDAAWEAHKLRNILAHEGGRYQLNQREAYRAFKMYEGIFYETGYLS